MNWSRRVACIEHSYGVVNIRADEGTNLCFGKPVSCVSFVRFAFRMAACYAGQRVAARLTGGVLDRTSREFWLVLPELVWTVWVELRSGRRVSPSAVSEHGGAAQDNPSE